MLRINHKHFIIIHNNIFLPKIITCAEVYLRIRKGIRKYTVALVLDIGVPYGTPYKMTRRARLRRTPHQGTVYGMVPD